MSSPPFRSWEDYFWPGTEVLRKKAGLRDPAELESFEGSRTLGRMVQLRAWTPVPGRFDLAHLQAVHRYLFQDVYEWAGQIRSFPLTKGSNLFCLPEHITSSAADIFDKLARDGYLRGLDVDTFAVKAADLLGDLNALHPFREGNGRTQRAFVEQVAAAAGHPIEWPSRIGRRNIGASRASLAGDNTGLQELVRDSLFAPPAASQGRTTDRLTSRRP